MEKLEPLWHKPDGPHVSQPDRQLVALSPEQKKREKKAIIWFLSPVISLPIVLVLFAISRFIGSQLLASAAPVATVSEGALPALGEPSTAASVFGIISVVLSITPIILIPVGLGMGAYYMLKKDK